MKKGEEVGAGEEGYLVIKSPWPGMARPETIGFVDSLPKIRSGKILRRVLKARALGIDPGDFTTLDDLHHQVNA